MKKKLLAAVCALAMLTAPMLVPMDAAAQTGGCTSCDHYEGLALCVGDDGSPWAGCRILEVCFMGGLFCIDRCVFSSYCYRPT